MSTKNDVHTGVQGISYRAVYQQRSMARSVGEELGVPHPGIVKNRSQINCDRQNLICQTIQSLSYACQTLYYPKHF